MASNVVSLVAGGRGTGKTDFIKNNVLLPSPMPKKLIVDTFDSQVWRTMKTFENPNGENQNIPLMDINDLELWRTGLYRVACSDSELVFNQIDEHLLNALVVFEDATKYIGKSLSKSTKKFIYDSKQKNLNLVFVFHSLASIPPDLVRAADTLTIFKTNEGRPSLTKYPFPDIPTAMQIVRESKNHFENVTIRLN